ncbi:MAG: tetratricopeptide repeat protein [Thermoanaerobaculia bacterium]
MNPQRERWQRMQVLLDALETLPPEDREDHLAHACPDDPGLRREVLSLLALEAEADAYLDELASELAPDAGTLPDLTGRRIGPYRLLRPLGRGGMGVVYEAERADGAFEQRVALKLLAVALTGTGAHARFLAERRILAGLEDPAIARIVDGGVTEDGTPWFAMERVDGVAIDRYCDQHRLAIRERLELFLQVCDAVEHAHRRLVVHRDLKPANVLVAGDGKVKLLDFGIAKLLDADGSVGAAPATRTALRLMTPEYASPEQVRGEAVTTASDVYQLGLLLYELLTGRRPYALRRRGGGELERAICEQPPLRPSTTLFRDEAVEPSSTPTGPTLEEICRARRVSPARLRRRLRGDLENIVLTALRKEPGRRYGSADRLAQDIRRHLDGLPVTARADTWMYRGRKFLRRHALATGAAAAVLVLVAGLTGFYTVRIQSERDRAEVERDRAQAERDRAQAEAAKAEQMSQFLAGLFRSSDPRQARGAELTARQLLDRGVKQVDRELAAQPEVQADLLQVLGSTYMELGLYDSAERLLGRALELRRRRLGPEHPEVAGVLGDLGLLRFRRGEYRQARDLLDEASARLTSSLGGDSPAVAEVLGNLGLTYRILGDYEASLAALRRALSIQRRVSGGDSEPVATVLSNLAVLFIEMGAYDRAEEHFERALAIHQRELGDDHPVVGSTLTNLAIVRAVRGKLDGLEAMYRRSLAIQSKAYGPIHTRVGVTLNNLGHFLTVSGRNDEAVEVLQRALEVQRAALGRDHPELAYPLASLGDAHAAAGQLRTARVYYRQSVAVRDDALGRRRQFDPILAHSLVGLGRLDVELGDRAAGERALTRALEIYRHAPASFDPQLVPSLLHLGRWLVDRQRCAEAAPLLRLARRLEAVKQNPSSPETGELTSLLARCQ